MKNIKPKYIFGILFLISNCSSYNNDFSNSLDNIPWMQNNLILNQWISDNNNLIQKKIVNVKTISFNPNSPDTIKDELGTRYFTRLFGFDSEIFFLFDKRNNIELLSKIYIRILPEEYTKYSSKFIYKSIKNKFIGKYGYPLKSFNQDRTATEIIRASKVQTEKIIDHNDLWEINRTKTIISYSHWEKEKYNANKIFKIQISIEKI